MDTGGVDSTSPIFFAYSHNFYNSYNGNYFIVIQYRRNAMLNANLLTENEKNHLHRLYRLWENFQKIASDLENEKAWLEYDESHYGEELHGEQKRIIDKTLELVRPAMNNAWWRYSDEWSRLNKKYS